MNLKKKYTIYYLTEPDGITVRYVGITTRTLTTRIGDHIRKARSGEENHRSNWIRQLIGEGEKPKIKLIEVTEYGIEREIFWIRYYKDAGCKLTNGTNGGEGFGIMSDENRLKMSIRMTGRKLSDNTIAAIKKYQTERIVSRETRDKISKSLKGRKAKPHTKESKDKISAANKGHTVSDAVRSIIRTKLSGIKHPNRMKSHCLRGHEYSSENTFINSNNRRECKECLKVKNKLRLIKRKFKYVKKNME